MQPILRHAMNCWGLVLGSWIAIGVGTPQGVSRPTTRLDLAVASTVTLHEPVIVTYKAMNQASVPVTVNIAPGLVGTFKFELTRPDGSHQSYQYRHDWTRSGSVVFPEIKVPAGTETMSPSILDEWLDFDGVGKYTLRVTRAGGLTVSAGVVTAPRDITFEIVVTPRDEQRLIEVCQEFADRLRTPWVKGAWSADDTAAMLAHVQDTVAVPFIEESIPHAYSKVLVEGLARIGGPKAKEALERLARNPDELLRGWAREALTKIRF